MLLTPLKESSDLASEIMQFLGAQQGSDTQISPSKMEQGLYFSSAVGLGAFYTLSLLCFLQV